MNRAKFHTLLIENGLDQPGQIEAAKLLGVHPRTVRHWLSGDRHIPLTIDRLFGVLKIAGVSAERVLVLLEQTKI
jgi:transcriptional regulator with XRE-family HTH domain